MVIPLGPELKGGRFFRTKAASMAAAYTESFRDACSAGAITVPLTSITLNTPLDMRRDGVLLVEEGTVPVGNYRLAHETFRGLVASAIEEMKRRQLLSPVAVVFHPLPIKPGNRIHLHAHLIASEVPDSNRPLIAEFLEDRFGSKRVWMSEPDERGRDAFATFAYPLWRSVETDTNKLIEDDRLLAVFYHQTHGLRFVQPLGGFHEWRARNAKERAGGISTAHRQSKDGLAGGDREFGTPPLTSDETDNRSATASSSGPEKLTASADRLGHQAVDAPNSGTIDHPYPHDKQSRLTADEPTIIHGVSAVWIGQARRVIARVSHYRGWQALVSEFQLAGHISEAKRLAQCATDSLLYDTAAMPPADHHGSNHHSNVSPVSAARQPAKPRSADSAVTPKSPSQSASGKPKVPTPTADVLRPSVVDVTAAHVRLTGSDGKHEQAPKPTAKTANQRDRGADVDASTAATAGKKGPTPTKTAGAAAERTAGGPTPQASADLDGKPATPHAGTGQ
ncbi:hypothetical protein, partial [Pseudolabrys sp. Root1462]|uniref:hypothetical protein n=1 Tax=Pseudolabrys sp. Root1462 TaxID=1736466 RepID=UPI001AEBD062